MSCSKLSPVDFKVLSETGKYESPYVTVVERPSQKIDYSNWALMYKFRLLSKNSWICRQAEQPKEGSL